MLVVRLLLFLLLLMPLAASADQPNVVPPVGLSQPVSPASMGAAGIGPCPANQFEIADTSSGPTCQALPTIFASGTVSITDSAAVGCVDQSTAVAGVTTSMVVNVSPQGAPAGAGSGNITWAGYPTANTVNIRVCTIVAVTAAATTYNFRVFQ